MNSNLEQPLRGSIRLRDVQDSDLPEFFVHHLDVEARRMCGLLPMAADGKAAFIARWHRNLADPDTRVWTIALGDEVVGYVAQFRRQDQPEVSYWLGRRYWGHGYATAALRQLLRATALRPLYARAARQNAASLRVLEKCGFALAAEDRYVATQGENIEELILVLGK